MAEPLPFELEADEVVFDEEAGKVTAQGRVEIVNNGHTIYANQVTYTIEQDKLLATGDVVFKETDDTALFVDSLELTGQMKQAVLTNLSLRLPELGTVLVAASGEKINDHTYAIHDATYSPCQTCKTGDRLPWQIRANTITYDSEEREMVYDDATFDVYGVPVFYLPWFKHPVGEARPKNGWLFPRFGTSTNLGAEVQLGYYHFNPENNSDYTLRPRFLGDRGLQMIAERRQITATTVSEIKGSFIDDDDTSSLRSHLTVNAEKTLKVGRRIGINSDITSDDTYLNDFFFENPSYLESTLYAEDASLNHYYSLSATRFQDLNENRDPGDTAQIYPHIQLEKIYELNQQDERLTLSADALNLHRDSGTRSRRVVAAAEYSKPYHTAAGDKITVSAQMRADVYHSENTDDNTDGISTRALPHAAIDWERPYTSASGNHTITPRVMAIAAPRGGNPEEIPNEDSVAYELEPSNLFTPNRFAGLDRVETGPRLVYGLDNRWKTQSKGNWRVFFGQSVRAFDDSALPQQGGTATKVSDWVGFVSANPYPWLRFNNRFRLDNATFDPRRMDTSLLVGDAEKTFARISHTFLDGGPEELNAEAAYQVTNDVAFTAKSQRDLADDNRQLLGQVGVEYTSCCYKLEFLVRRRGFTSQNIEPSTDYLLNLQLLTLGRERE